MRRRFMKNMPAPKMSFSTLYMEGEFPTFFGWVDGRRVAGSGALSGDPEQRETQLANLENEGISAILTLTETAYNAEELRGHGIEMLHLPVVDLTPPSLEQLGAGCRFIDHHVQLGGSVLVHCREGIGRTGTMLSAWFMWDQQISATTAVTIIREKRFNSVHKTCQEDQLVQFDRCLRDPTLKISLEAGGFTQALADRELPAPPGGVQPPLSPREADSAWDMAPRIVLASPSIGSVLSAEVPGSCSGLTATRRMSHITVNDPCTPRSPIPRCSPLAFTHITSPHARVVTNTPKSWAAHATPKRRCLPPAVKRVRSASVATTAVPSI